MVDANITLHHQLLQIPKTKPEPEIPTHAQDDDFGFEMPSPEQCRPVSPHARVSLADRPPQFATHPNRALPAATLNQFVKSLAHRIAGFPAAGQLAVKDR